MKKYRTITEKRYALSSIQCDKCGITIFPEDYVEWEEVVSWQTTGGYGSIFGDGTIVGFDLCQHCAKIVLGKYIKERRR